MILFMKKMPKIGLILSIILYFWGQSLANKCLFRGKCGENTSGFGDYPIPCIVDTAPQPFKNESTKDILKQFTPELFKSPDPVFCCTDQQVLDLENQLSMAKNFMNRCPSCFVNFAKIFFHMTCNPRHSEFLEVTKKSASTLQPGKQMVSTLSYYMSNDFGAKTYNSCAGVKFPQGDASIMTLLCGGRKICSPFYFLEYIGKSSPFEIDFKLIQDMKQGEDKIPMNEKAISCSDAPIGYSNNSCTCTDCAAKCRLNSASRL